MDEIQELETYTKTELRARRKRAERAAPAKLQQGLDLGKLLKNCAQFLMQGCLTRFLQLSWKENISPYKEKHSE